MTDEWERITRREALGVLALGSVGSLSAGEAVATDRTATPEWTHLQYDPTFAGAGPLARGPTENVVERWGGDHEGGSGGTVVVHRGVAFFGTGVSTLVAVDAETGAREGTSDLPGDVTRGLAASDGTVYAATDDGTVLALGVDGGERWRRSLPNSFARHDGAVTVADGTVYVPTRTDSGPASLYALSATSGEVRWRTDQATSGAAVSGGSVYLSQPDVFLRALDPADGSERWRFAETPDRNDVSRPIPTVWNDLVLGVGARTEALVAADAASGDEQFRVDLPSRTWTQPAVRDGVAYVATQDGGDWRLAAADVRRRERRWSVPIPARVETGIVAGEGVVYVDCDSTLFAFDAADGTELWRYPLGDTGALPAVVGDGLLVALTESADGLARLGEADTVPDPTAAFSYSPSGPRAGDPVGFDGGDAAAGRGTLIRYEWAFGADAGFQATGEVTNHAFPSAGEYRVRLRVTDNNGQTATTARTVTVRPSPSTTGSTTGGTETTAGESEPTTRLTVPTLDPPETARATGTTRGPTTPTGGPSPTASPDGSSSPTASTGGGPTAQSGTHGDPDAGLPATLSRWGIPPTAVGLLGGGLFALGAGVGVARWRRTSGGRGTVREGAGASDGSTASSGDAAAPGDRASGRSPTDPASDQVETVEYDRQPAAESDLAEFEVNERVGTLGDVAVHRARYRPEDRPVRLWTFAGGDTRTVERERLDRIEEHADLWERVGDEAGVTGVVATGTSPTPWLAADPAGRSLASAESLSLAGRLSALVEVCEALDRLHGYGLVHGWLTPDQVGVGDDVSIDCWGLRRAGTEVRSESTYVYPAPEQLDAEFGIQDGQTDVFGVGALAYELLTGRSPFGDDPTSVLASDPAPPTDLVDVPSVVDDALGSALAVHKEFRQESIVYLRDDLADALEVVR